MPKIKLELYPEEYRTLVELVYLGNWMVNGIRDERDERYDKVEQKAFQYAPDAGLEGSFEQDEETGQLLPAASFEEGQVARFIEEYDDYTFWEELADKLARRELGKRYSPEAFEKLDDDEREKVWDEATKPFLEEFQKNGVSRLRLADGPDAG